MTFVSSTHFRKPALDNKLLMPFIATCRAVLFFFSFVFFVLFFFELSKKRIGNRKPSPGQPPTLKLHVMARNAPGPFGAGNCTIVETDHQQFLPPTKFHRHVSENCNAPTFKDDLFGVTFGSCIDIFGPCWD